MHALNKNKKKSFDKKHEEKPEVSICHEQKHGNFSHEFKMRV